jgi:colanic acid biosynthesis protein WcaH
MPPSSRKPNFLNSAELDSIVRLAPLVAIDLIIRNGHGEVLLGLRNNEPAKGRYFVPGGMVLKNERLADAFARIVKNETDYAADFANARLLGVFEHFYDNNRSGKAGYGTHYVVLGYDLEWVADLAPKADEQHADLRWWPVPELMRSDRVHENTKAYFRHPARAGAFK